PTAGPSGWYSAPGLAPDPDPAGTTLLAYQGDSSPAAAATFDTATDPATPISTGNIGSASSGAACGGRQVNIYSTQDVTKATGKPYATPDAGPAAVAIAPDGTVAVGGQGTAVINTGGNTGDMVYVYS